MANDVIVTKLLLLLHDTNKTLDFKTVDSKKKNKDMPSYYYYITMVEHQFNGLIHIILE